MMISMKVEKSKLILLSIHQLSAFRASSLSKAVSVVTLLKHQPMLYVKSFGATFFHIGCHLLTIMIHEMILSPCWRPNSLSGIGMGI
mmetsp:Transcript_20286/g.36649  ORF Transcript_20286/g.36649 Transcript_20286/m.36649 type:complete len:87 (-) Transcript_20286:86-346(-)